MKNVFLLLLAVVLTGGVLFGANAVNASYDAQNAEISGSCCPSVETIEAKTMDSGCCPSGAATTSPEDCPPGKCSSEQEARAISSEQCPPTGSCPTSGSCPDEDREKTTKRRTSI